MSRIVKWKDEKVKIKVVFRLQFHATHIPQTGWDKLFVSFIPADSGKATAKTTKANVKNGTCKWGDPIYETTRLLQDAKTKQYDEKLYKLVVAMGSSRSSVLGEANINLADYADASNPFDVALPLHGCNSGTVLHVTIQLLTSKTGFREFEQQRERREKGLQMTTNQHIHGEPIENLSASVRMANDYTDKVNGRVRFKTESKELPSVEEEVELNEEYTDSAIGIDGSSNTSESLYADKHDTSSTQGIDSFKRTISGGLGRLSLSQSPQPGNGDHSNHQPLQQGSSDWVHGWSSDYSVDNDLATAYEENGRLREILEVAECSILELKLEISSLHSQADELGAETQKFVQQLATEIASGEKLAEEVSILKSECSKFKDDFEQLIRSGSSPHFTNKEIIEKDQACLFQDLRIRWLQGLLVMEDKLKEVQNKACLRYEDSDFGFLYPELEALQCILQDLKQGTTAVIPILNLPPEGRTNIKDIGALSVQKPVQFIPRDRLEGFDAGRYRSEGILHCLSRASCESEEPDPIDTISVMERKICELLRELQESKAEQESLAKKMDQMECYYEALILELEESQKKMLGELQNIRNEHSSCQFTISSYKTQMETMHQDMNEQFSRFAEDKHNLESLNKELEIRAVTSETALKRARWNYSIAVDQLQKDLELLSSQVLSMFKTNENLIRQAFAEASQPCFQEYLETVDKGDAPFLQERYKTRVQRSQALDIVSQNTENELSSDQLIPLQNFFAEKKNLIVHTDLVSEVQRNLDALDFLSCSKDELPGSCTILESKLDFQESETAKSLLHQNQNSDLNKQFVGGDILLEDLKRLLHLQEERNRKAEAEICEMHVVNLHLDVFSRVLQETLHEACDGIRVIKEKMDEFAQRLEHSSESKELLLLRLQTALDDVNALSEDKASCITKCNDLALQSQILEEKLKFTSDENCLLTLKIKEYEGLMMECRSYKSKYMSCTVENTELLNLLQQETLEKTNLQNEVSSVYEELNTVKAEFDKQASVKDNLDKTVTFLQDKLGGLMTTMVSYDEQLNGSALQGKPFRQELENNDFINCILHLEELQTKACEKILQLSQEKTGMEEERDIARRSLNSEGSEILIMKQKFESHIQEMVTKLDVSNARVEKLQLELEACGNKLKFSSEAEGKHAEQNHKLFSKNAVLEVELQHVITENRDLAQKILALEEESNIAQRSLSSKELEILTMKQKFESRIQEMVTKLDASNALVKKLQLELEAFGNKLKLSSEAEGKYAEQNQELFSKNAVLEVELQHVITENRDLAQKILALEEESNISRRSLSSKESEILTMKQRFESHIQEMVTKLDVSNARVEKLQLELEAFGNKMKFSSEAEGKHAEQNQELFSKIALLEVELQHVITENRDLAQKILALESVNEELERTKLTVADFTQENHSLMMFLRAENEESVKLASELNSLKESLRGVHDELQSERGFRAELEGKVVDLSSELNEKHEQLVLFNEQKAKLVSLKQLISDLELEKSRVCRLLLHSEECLKKADENASLLRLQVTDLESYLAEVQENFLAADVELIFTRNQFKPRMKELFQQLESLDECHGEFCLNYLDVLAPPNGCIAAEGACTEENARLLTALNSLKSEFEASVRVNTMSAELEKFKTKPAIAEVSDIRDKRWNELEVEQLKGMLVTSEQQIDSLRSSRDELEITVMVLKAKLDEQLAHISLLEEYGNELTMLRNQHNELAHRLSEQILKTEEFKNLTIHLKELKDKADAGCIQSREKRETEGQSVAMQESLRMAFIREQCETKLQEMRSQLYISKRHGEEMLMKLQDALDEVENRKKSEASHIKRNEELSLKILELETELQTTLSDKREKVKAYDRMKAELECSLISLDCCKEDKQKLEASLQECNEERSRIAIELSAMKERLVSSALTISIQEGNSRSGILECMSTERFTKEVPQEEPLEGDLMLGRDKTDIVSANGLDRNHFPISFDQNSLLSCKKVEDACPLPSDESNHSIPETKLQFMQGGLISKSVLGSSRKVLMDQEAPLQNDAKNIALINDHFKVQSLKSSMDFLHKELERMKNENLASLLPQDYNHCGPACQGLQRELLQLHKANEQLGSIFPLFNEFSTSGNALERVLALEIELAEALQAKKKSTVHFQSSFLKQHSDEEAIFQSFRDINELIKDMLELKGRYTAVETELKEMHDRYSQLSLQFAEVEGERQKLTMTLKNVRVAKKLS